MLTFFDSRIENECSPEGEQYLRDQRAGQATFIPLETIQAKPVNDKYRSYSKGARLAIDVITYDAANEKAMQHACGNALVCDSMDIARHVCYDRGQEVKGTLLFRSYSLLVAEESRQLSRSRAP
jgi:chromosome segregation ATPase